LINHNNRIKNSVCITHIESATIETVVKYHYGINSLLYEEKIYNSHK
jgi:hypothetical protein